MKRSHLLLTIILALLLSACTPSAPSNSVTPGPTDNPEQVTEQITERQDTGGLTRGEVVQMFYDHMDYYSYEYTTTFTDLANKPYAEAAVWAQNAGLLFWIEGDLFGGEEILTRVELSAMLARYFRPRYEHDLLHMTNAEGDGYEFYYNQIISISADFDEVPDWAKEYMLSALSGLLKPSNDSFGVYNFAPYGGVTADEVSYALEMGHNQNLWVRGYVTRAYDFDYSEALVFNPDSGEKLALGMKIEELETIAGMPIYNDWAFRVDNALVSCLFGYVSGITLQSANPSNWNFNGIGLGSTRAEAEAILGEPDEFYAKGTLRFSYSRYDTALYIIQAPNNPDSVVQDDTTRPYYLELCYSDDGVLQTLNLTPYYPFTPDGLPISSALSGTVLFYASGSGDERLQASTPPFFYLDIEYSGSGDFSITQNSETIFSHSGAYVGRQFYKNQEPAPLEIHADGDWEIIGKLLVSRGERSEMSGVGDYVIPIMNLWETYRVTHEGNSLFEVKYIPTQVQDMEPIDEEILVSAEGDFDETIQFEGAITMYPGDLVITTDGNWSIERVFEFTVVDKLNHTS